MAKTGSQEINDRTTKKKESCSSGLQTSSQEIQDGESETQRRRGTGMRQQNNSLDELGVNPILSPLTGTKSQRTSVPRKTKTPEEVLKNPVLQAWKKDLVNEIVKQMCSMTLSGVISGLSRDTGLVGNTSTPIRKSISITFLPDRSPPLSPAPEEIPKGNKKNDKTGKSPGNSSQGTIVADDEELISQGSGKTARHTSASSQTKDTGHRMTVKFTLTVRPSVNEKHPFRGYLFLNTNDFKLAREAEEILEMTKEQKRIKKMQNKDKTNKKSKDADIETGAAVASTSTPTSFNRRMTAFDQLQLSRKSKGITQGRDFRGRRIGSVISTKNLGNMENKVRKRIEILEKTLLENGYSFWNFVVTDETDFARVTLGRDAIVLQRSVHDSRPRFERDRVYEEEYEKMIEEKIAFEEDTTVRGEEEDESVDESGDDMTLNGIREEGNENVRGNHDENLAEDS